MYLSMSNATRAPLPPAPCNQAARRPASRSRRTSAAVRVVDRRAAPRCARSSSAARASPSAPPKANRANAARSSDASAAHRAARPCGGARGARAAPPAARPSSRRCDLLVEERACAGPSSRDDPLDGARARAALVDALGHPRVGQRRAPGRRRARAVMCAPTTVQPCVNPANARRTGPRRRMPRARRRPVGLSGGVVRRPAARAGAGARRSPRSASAIQNFSNAHVTRNAVTRASLWVCVTSTLRRCAIVAPSSTAQCAERARRRRAGAAPRRRRRGRGRRAGCRARCGRTPARRTPPVRRARSTGSAS